MGVPSFRLMCSLSSPPCHQTWWPSDRRRLYGFHSWSVRNGKDINLCPYGQSTGWIVKASKRNITILVHKTNKYYRDNTSLLITSSKDVPLQGNMAYLHSFLTLRWVFICTPRSPCTQAVRPRYPLIWRLRELHNRSGSFGEYIYVSPFLRIKPGLFGVRLLTSKQLL